MQLTINDKTVNLYFGVGFVRELDKRCGLETQGLKLGMALTGKIPALFGGDVAALADILFAATITEKNRPTQKEVDNYIDNVENLEQLFEQVLDELEQSNGGKKLVKQMKENLVEQANNQN